METSLLGHDLDDLMRQSVNEFLMIRSGETLEQSYSQFLGSIHGTLCFEVVEDGEGTSEGNMFK